jgi:hypothetical protein
VQHQGDGADGRLHDQFELRRKQVRVKRRADAGRRIRRFEVIIRPCNYAAEPLTRSALRVINKQ